MKKQLLLHNHSVVERKTNFSLYRAEVFECTLATSFCRGEKKVFDASLGEKASYVVKSVSESYSKAAPCMAMLFACIQMYENKMEEQKRS